MSQSGEPKAYRGAGGLVSRADAEKAIKCVVAIIEAGSTRGAAFKLGAVRIALEHYRWECDRDKDKADSAPATLSPEHARAVLLMDPVLRREAVEMERASEPH